MRKNKIIIKNILLLFTLLFSFVSCADFLNNAYNFKEEYAYSYDDEAFTYEFSFNTGKLTINLKDGADPSADFEIVNIVKPKEVVEVVLDDRIERIPDNAFADMIKLQNIRLPVKLKYLGKNILPSELKQLHLDISYLDNPDIINVSIFESVTNFSYVKNDTLYVRYKDGVPDFNEKSYSYDNGYQSDYSEIHYNQDFENKPLWNGLTVSNLVILPGTAGVGNFAFSNYFINGLRTIELCSDLKRLGKKCFMGQYGVDQIDIPENLITIFSASDLKEPGDDILADDAFLGWQDNQSIKVSFGSEIIENPRYREFINRLTKFNYSKLLFSDNTELDETEYIDWSCLYIDNDTGSCLAYARYRFNCNSIANKVSGGVLTFDNRIKEINWWNNVSFDSINLPSELINLETLSVKCSSTVTIPSTVTNIFYYAFNDADIPSIALDWPSWDETERDLQGLNNLELLNKTLIYYSDGVGYPITEDENTTFVYNNATATIIDNHILEVKGSEDYHNIAQLLNNKRLGRRLKNDGTYEYYNYTLRDYCEYDTVILKGDFSYFYLNVLNISGENVKIDIQADIGTLYSRYMQFAELKLGENVINLTSDFDEAKGTQKILLPWNKGEISFRNSTVLSQVCQNGYTVYYEDGSEFKSEDFIGSEYIYEQITLRVIDSKTLEIIGNDSSGFIPDEFYVENKSWETVNCKGYFRYLDLGTISDLNTKIVVDADVYSMNIISLNFKELHINGRVEEFSYSFADGVIGGGNRDGSIYLGCTKDNVIDSLKDLCWDAYAHEMDVYLSDGTKWTPVLTPDWVNDHLFIYKYKGYSARIMSDNCLVIDADADTDTSPDLYEFLHNRQYSDFGNGSLLFPVALSEARDIYDYVMVRGRIDNLELSTFDFPIRTLDISASVKELDVSDARFSELRLHCDVQNITGSFASNPGARIYLDYWQPEDLPSDYVPVLQESVAKGITVCFMNGTEWKGDNSLSVYNDITFVNGSAKAEIKNSNTLKVTLATEAEFLYGLLHDYGLSGIDGNYYGNVRLADYSYDTIIIEGNADYLSLSNFDFSTSSTTIYVYAVCDAISVSGVNFSDIYLNDKVQKIDERFTAVPGSNIHLQWNCFNIPDEVFGPVSYAFLDGINVYYSDGVSIDVYANTVELQDTLITVFDSMDGNIELVISGSDIKYDELCSLLNMKRFKTVNMHGYTYADGIIFTEVTINGHMDELRLPGYSCFENCQKISYGDSADISVLGEIPFNTRYMYIPDSVRTIACTFDSFNDCEEIVLGWNQNDPVERDDNALQYAVNKGIRVLYSDNTFWID